MSNFSQLDPGQVLKLAADEVNGAIKVNVVASASGGSTVSIISGDGSGKLATVTATNAVLVDGSATTQPVSAASLPLPTGASTSAKQDTGNTSLSSIDGKIVHVDTGAVVVSSSALPTGASTSALQTSGNTSLSSIDTKTPALGQALAASSVPVVLTASQLTTLTPLSTVAATQSGTWNVNNVSGTVSLPTGAATSANQTTANTSLASIATNTTGVALDASVNSLLKPASTLAAVTSVGSIGSTVVIKADTAGNQANALKVDGSAVTQPVSAASLPLPSGASTAANQTTANTSLSSIDTKTPALGQALAAASVPVVLTAAQLSTLTPLSSVSSNITQFGGTNVSTGTGASGAGIPRVTVANDSNILATQSGTWNITNVSGTVSLPTGASTAAKQPALGTAGTASSDVITVQGIASMTALKVDGSAVTQPVSAASLPLPSGASTSANQTTANTSLSSIDSKVPALGQALAAASVPVVLTASQLTTLTPLSTIAATQSGTWNVNNVSGTVSLPTGAATSANQTTANTSLSTIATNTTPLAQGSTTSGQSGSLSMGAVTTSAPTYTTGQTDPLSLTTAGALRTDASATTQPISASALPLPTGASTSANQTTANTSLSSIDGKVPALGQALAAASVPVVLTASQLTTLTPLSTVAATQSGTWTVRNQDGAGNSLTSSGNSLDVNIKSAAIQVPVIEAGLSPGSKARLDYSSTNVTSSAYVQLIASSSAATREIEIFESGGFSLVLAIGGAGSEVDQFYIPPGGNGRLKITLSGSLRYSIKAVGTATISAGEFLINLYG